MFISGSHPEIFHYIYESVPKFIKIENLKHFCFEAFWRQHPHTGSYAKVLWTLSLYTSQENTKLIWHYSCLMGEEMAQSLSSPTSHSYLWTQLRGQTFYTTPFLWISLIWSSKLTNFSVVFIILVFSRIEFRQSAAIMW